MSDDYRQHFKVCRVAAKRKQAKHTKAEAEPIPATEVNAYKPRAPRAAFSRADRFPPPGARFVSQNHTADMLCTATRDVDFVDRAAASAHLRRAPAWRMGPPVSAPHVGRTGPDVRIDSLAAAGRYDVNDVTLRKAPIVRFGKAERFPSYESKRSRHHPNRQDAPIRHPPIQYEPLFSSRSRFARPRRAPAYSFGPRNRKHFSDSYAGRSGWITYSVRGGVAKPGSFDTGIGPGAYDLQCTFGAPRNYGSDAARAYTRSPAWNIGGAGKRSKRFEQDRLQFISRGHTSAVNPDTPAPGTYDIRSKIGAEYPVGRQMRETVQEWIPSGVVKRAF